VVLFLGTSILITLTSFWLICPKHILVNEKEQVCAGPRGGAECKIGCPSYRKKEIATRYADMQRLLDHADAVVAPSHFMAQTFQRESRTLHPTYIPYGFENRRASSKQRVYTAGQPLIFFFGGRLVPEKGVELLLMAFRRLPSSQVRLHIHGDGPLRPTVERAVQADPRIHYGGVYKHEQLGELLEQVDVLIVPSTWPENMPLIMQEAQACSVPTLVSDVGGMTECVNDGVNGFTFRVGDVEDLQRKLQMLIDQPEILNGIKEKMRNPKPGQYRVTSLAEEAGLYLALYAQILNTPVATVADRQ
jgi:glycosyltransferase involved in cell wall biosynthesis